MNGGRSDASTSTDDVKGPPLCLFYFTHPFGVVSPEPPTVGPAPPHITRAFLNMQPMSPFCWPPAGPATSTTDSYRSTGDSTTLSYDLGDATVYDNPVSVVSMRRRCTLELPPRRDSISSSLFSSDVWWTSSSSARDIPRRAVPYHRTLPPLRLPSPASALTDRSEDNVWPCPRRYPDKFSLPPIELQTACVRGDTSERPSSGGSARPFGRRLAVPKPRRRRHRRADVRRVLACLMSRAQRDGAECSPSPALQRVLHTIREAWAEPRSLRQRCRALSRTYDRERLKAITQQQAEHTEPTISEMSGIEVPRADASPGLLRRRYSAPETIMRKYRLAQQQSDSEESGAAGVATVASASASPPGESPHRHLRRDRELMRKSALLRRMWARAPACRCGADSRETRSLDTSRSELRPLSPALTTSPERRHLGRSNAYSDSTVRVEPDLSSSVNTATDSERSRFDSTSADRGSPEPDTAKVTSEPSPPDTFLEDRSYTDSDSFSTSMSTAKEIDGLRHYGLQRDEFSVNGHIEGRISERSVDENDDRNTCPFTDDVHAPSYDLLEIVVSETSDSNISERNGKAAPVPESRLLTIDDNKKKNNINIDEYVSNILVESLNSLTDQLESMNASIGGDRKINIVEKEIKVKLQNTGVNTIVHLSPTSNNQIIFGNEELCNEESRPHITDECNNPLTIRDEPHSDESNNNLTSSTLVTTVEPFVPLLQHENVNQAVLQQIQKLFRDEVQNHAQGEYPTDALPSISHIEISNVDVYINDQITAGDAKPGSVEITARSDGALIAGVGAGNYFGDGENATMIPRFSAFPYTESMEVHASSSSEGDALYSECTSLVDSLEDPNSPRYAAARGARLPRRADLVRSAVDVLELLPEAADCQRRERERAEAFFVRIRDDERDHDEENIRVAEYMPENIKQRLYRRHHKRELRMECARRTKVKQLKKELERRRHEEMSRARRELERECATLVDALVGDVIAQVAHEEYKCMRIERRNGKLAKSEQNLTKRNKNSDPEVFKNKGSFNQKSVTNSRNSANKENQKTDRNQIHGKLLARPSLGSCDRTPRRIYQKSEIREGEKCIEILEILEYVNGSESSSETTNSDENQNYTTRCKKSRIPVPVYERIQRTSKNDARIRLTRGDGSRASSPSSSTVAGMLLEALTEPRRVVPPEPRSRSNSLRFKRVFDMIPEERSSLSVDSSAEDAERGRRASAPDVATPASAPAPAPLPSTRSAGTSPLAEGTRQQRSQTTMTSPCTKSAATSPPREGRRESVGSQRAACAGERARSSSDSGDSGGLLCSPAPRWLAAAARRRRHARRTAARGPPASPPPPRASNTEQSGPGGWSVTVAGSCRATLPADVEMRLRFPYETRSTATHASTTTCQECSCTQCSGERDRVPQALPPACHSSPAARDNKLTLTMKKEAQDSSILASKSMRKSSALPELETFRTSRTKLKSSVKTRRGYSLHCWLPEDEPASMRGNNKLSVLGCAIIPELKPRVPTMSERDLTRVYTPRHYLRS